MSVQYEVRPFAEELRIAVQAFNLRLSEGGLDKALLYPEDPTPRIPPREGARIYQEQFLVCDNESNVRGGFILTQELWSLCGENTWTAHLRLPISEGAVNRIFKAVGPLVFEAALERQPRLYTLGMGGFHTAVARRIKSLGWSMASTPFYFRLFRPASLLRTSPYLRRRPLTRFVADVAAASGLGTLGIGVLHAIAGIRGRRTERLSVQEAPDFGCWAEELWENCRRKYLMIGPRDRDTLNTRYPAHHPQFLKLRFNRSGRAVGWAVLLDSQMRANKYFGDARVGALVDYFAAPEDAAAVIAGATEFLRRRGVDLAVTNQLHASWLRGFRRCGYLRGPSNYVFALSPTAAALVHPFEGNLGEFFVTRGDGAGPERLME